MRLCKALAHAGHGSRREMDAVIRSGCVTVDGVTLRKPDAPVDPAAQEILLNGINIDYADYYTIMLHKPAGVVTATEDTRERTVLDILDERERRWGLFPAGRLDKDTTGLLLLTTDGALAHRVMSPNHHLSKCYIATIDGTITPEMPPRFAKGLTLGDGTVCRPAALELLSENQARVILREGKYHQVKRMLAACGVTVTALHRRSMGGLALDDALAPGAWKRLTTIDLVNLFENDLSDAVSL